MEAWQTHDPARDAAEGAAAAFWLAVLCLVAGLIPEAIGWGERASAATAAAAVRHQALGVLAITLFADGRGPEGLARLAPQRQHPRGKDQRLGQLAHPSHGSPD